MMWRRLKALAADLGGVAMTEFALGLPFMVMLGTLGIEYTHYIVIKKRVSEIAAQIADNASRMGDVSVLTNKPVSEAEINDLFVARRCKQAIGWICGRTAALSCPAWSRIARAGNGYIGSALSEPKKIHASSYGVEGDGANGTAFQGMGCPGTKITATKGSAVMYVEIAYSYRPIIGVMPISRNDIVEVAAYNIWEMRDLSQVYSSPRVAASTCS